MEDIRKYIRQISRMAQTYTTRALKGTGLGASEIQALRHITFHGDMSQKSLTEHMDIDKGAVARLITSLEEKGYLTRRSDEADKRINRLIPTAAAEALKSELIATETGFYEWLFADLTTQQQEALEQMLGHAFQKAKAERRAGFPHLLGGEEGRPCT